MESSPVIKHVEELEGSKARKAELREKLSQVISRLEKQEQHIRIYPQENGCFLVTIENDDDRYPERFGKDVWVSTCAYELVRALRRLKYKVEQDYGETMYGDYLAKLYCTPKHIMQPLNQP